MSVYYTKGEKHRTNRGDYDYIYNRAYVWNDLFSDITKEMLRKRKDISFSRHLRDYDNEGNREFSLTEINRNSLINGEVVEIETEVDWFGNTDEDIELIMKAVIRLPQREDGEQVVAVVDFNGSDTFVKTAWLNKASDNHQTGLDISEFAWDINGKYGYYLNSYSYQQQAWEITNYSDIAKL